GARYPQHQVAWFCAAQWPTFTPPLTHEALPAAIDALTEGDRETRVFLRADRVVAYGELMEVMNLLRASGYVRLALVGLESVSSVPAPASGDEQSAP
ncbi:biopolymer transporter ExbD, partial [Pelagibacterium lacus]|uniref:biopolymer transporter ExbD n=1 Tax=Pelagibacterium lacus TaxID=2282655 RepID=UPI00319EAD4C